MQLFNPQVSVSELPQIELLEYLPLEKRYLKALLLSTIFFNLILALLIIIFFKLNPFELPLWVFYSVGIVFVLRFLWSVLVRIKGFEYKSYALREKDIVYKTGWLFRKTTTAPFNRVQHLRVDQGPIERKLNLSKLKIFTAGGSSSDMTIPGLDPIMANKLKEYIVGKTADDEEE
jgi:membrane protein YdbS with pleckstrin-like domain